MPARITSLEETVSALAPEARERFGRLYDFAVSRAEVRPPQAMIGWITKAFRYLSDQPPDTDAWREEILEKIRHQEIVHVVNRATGQATLFNAVRALRPIEAKGESDVAQKVEEARAKCSFCRPLELTPANTFGRIGTDKTCANVAAYDGYHGLVIFGDHSPLRFRHDEFRPAEIADLLATSRAWAEKARAEDPAARFFFLMWNCLWKAGASIIHGHAQMTVGRRFHYGKVEALRRSARAYAAEHGADYFADVVAVHKALGLAADWGGVAALAHLVPTKEREIILLAERLDSPGLPEAIWRALKVYAAQDVKAYNLAVYMPPLGDADPAWRGFPVMVHLVDRGDPNAGTADIGAMELYASAVVSSDPFALAEAMK